MKQLIYPVFIIFLTFWAIKPLFHLGFFPMHDDQQIARLYELDQALKGGQIPPRWVGNLGFGYGYPFYNFYPPLVYYLGEIAHLIGFDLITSIKIVMALGFLLAALSMYLFAKEILGKEVAVLAAVLYTYVPYHSVDLYVRGALAEFFSFVVFPLILFSVRKLIRAPKMSNALFFGLSLSALILTHNLMVFPFSIFVILYTLFLFYEERKNNFGFKFLFFIFSLLVSFGLTAYFTLPAIFEKKFTLVDEILTRELANYKLHFVYLRQFWHSPWGYGGSIYGLLDGISFQLGKIHIILSFLGIISLIIVIARWLGRKSNFPDDKQKEFIIYSLLFILSIFLASFHSLWLWNILKPLWYLQFPWRFLAVTAVFSSVLGAYGGKYVLELFKNKTLQNIIFIIFIILIIFINSNYFRPARYLNVTDKDYITKEDISWRISKTSFEFVPKGVKTTLSDIGTTQLDIKKDEIAKTNYEIVKGNLIVQEKLILPHKKVFEVNAKENGILRINTYNFPSWQVRIDGEKTLINDKNKLKLITINIPKGDHTIIAEFKNTPIRNLGNILTLLTISLISILLLIKILFINF